MKTSRAAQSSERRSRRLSCLRAGQLPLRYWCRWPPQGRRDTRGPPPHSPGNTVWIVPPRCFVVVEGTSSSRGNSIFKRRRTLVQADLCGGGTLTVTAPPSVGKRPIFTGDAMLTHLLLCLACAAVASVTNCVMVVMMARKSATSESGVSGSALWSPTMSVRAKNSA